MPRCWQAIRRLKDNQTPPALDPWGREAFSLTVYLECIDVHPNDLRQGKASSI